MNKPTSIFYGNKEFILEDNNYYFSKKFKSFTGEVYVDIYSKYPIYSKYAEGDVSKYPITTLRLETNREDLFSLMDSSFYELDIPTVTCRDVRRKDKYRAAKENIKFKLSCFAKDISSFFHSLKLLISLYPSLLIECFKNKLNRD